MVSRIILYSRRRKRRKNRKNISIHFSKLIRHKLKLIRLSILKTYILLSSDVYDITYIVIKVERWEIKSNCKLISTLINAVIATVVL